MKKFSKWTFISNHSDELNKWVITRVRKKNGKLLVMRKQIISFKISTTLHVNHAHGCILYNHSNAFYLFHVKWNEAPLEQCSHDNLMLFAF